MKFVRGLESKPLTTATGYFAISCIWIVVSDWLVGTFAPSLQSFLILNIAKGLIFLAITAGLLFLVLRRLQQTSAALSEESRAALQKSELHFRLLVEQASDGIFLADATGHYVDVNSAGAEMLGYSREEVLGLSFSDVLMEEELVRLAAEVERLSESKTVMSEWKFRRKDGTPLIGELSGRRLPDGRLQGIVRDISQRRQAEQELRESKRWLDAAMDAARLAVWSYDLVSEELVTNARGKEILGLPEHARVTIPDLLSRIIPEDRKMIEADIWRQPPDSEIRLEFRVVSPIGVRWVYARGSGSTDESGEHIRTNGVVMDITERKLAEGQLKLLQEELQQAQKMEAIGQLAGGVAHDFNNLLHVVMSYAELADLKLPADSPVKRHLQMILEAARRATEVTGQLLAFGRKQILNSQVFCLNQSVANTSKMLGRLIGEDVLLKTDLDLNLASTKADPGQVEQIIMNLAVNARDAMPEGGKLTIATKNVSIDKTHSSIPAGNYVCLSLSDTGCGMAESVKSHIFEPFFTTKAKGKGTGLGLATVYGIVKQSEGFIECTSTPGKGTRFDVYFPATEPFLPLEDSGEDIESLAAHNETILLVEDDESVRESATAMLESIGFHVLVAESGDEAIEISREYGRGIELVLTDVVMPCMSGNQLAAKLRENRPDTKFLFMSGYTDDAVLRQGIKQSAVPFLQKPFTLRAMARKIEEVLRAPAQTIPLS